jgi:hypothetical protein
LRAAGGVGAATLAALVLWIGLVAAARAGGDGASGAAAVPLGFEGVLPPTLSVPETAETGCVGCHPGRDRGHEPGHGFAQRACTACHAGDAAATTQEAAHRGLVAYPGDLDNAARTCGTCHPAQLTGVLTGPMATLRDMVPGTRRAFGEDPAGEPRSTAGPRPDAGVVPDPGPAAAPIANPGPVDGDRGPAPSPLSGNPARHGPPGLHGVDRGSARAALAGLGHSPADSLLRKLCVSCHLGQPKTRHALDPIRDRGGGCLACHVNAYPPGAHAEVSARVRDERCFGCHSRSSRIALAYAGLAEVDETALGRPDRSILGRLPDGRLVERLPADVHHRAGLRCVDCHRGAEVMNLAGEAGAQRPPGTAAAGAADEADSDRPAVPRARCEGCHRPADSQPPPGPERAGTGATETGSDAGPQVAPPYRPDSHPLAREHARLTCAACHSQWAPQCFGCHVRFDHAGEQWDHHERRVTPGRWVERRWNVRNGLPTLALGADGRIRPVVPGMIRTAEHPAWDAPRPRAHFAPVSPHTVGRARACETCHPARPTIDDTVGSLPP